MYESFFIDQFSEVKNLKLSKRSESLNTIHSKSVSEREGIQYGGGESTLYNYLITFSLNLLTISKQTITVFLNATGYPGAVANYNIYH